MSVFPESVEALRADRSRAGWAMGVAVVGLAAWIAWAFVARVSVYALAESARLEVDRAPHALQAPLAGRVLETHLELGRVVAAGDVVVRLDAESQRLELEEARRRSASLPAELKALHDEIGELEQALRAERERALAAIGQARAREREVLAQLNTKAEEERRLSQLAAGHVSELDLVRVRDEKRALEATLDSRRSEMTRLEWEQKSAQGKERARLDELGREIISRQGQLDTAVATTRRLEHEITRRDVIAPIGGQLAAVSDLRVGAYVVAGEKLATIVPSGTLRIVAQFRAADALGRVRPGQRARLRLDGFPWPQFDPVPAIVAKVAMEPQSSLVRVELEVERGGVPDVPLEHGLPGAAEVEVERVHPIALLLRAAGRRLQGEPGAR